ETLKRTKANLGPDHPNTLQSMTSLARAHLAAGKPERAEPLLREALAILGTKTPEDWTSFEARSLLGGCLLAQKNYAEAEPLLLRGYEGLEAREAKIPVPYKKRLAEAGARIVQLYEEWGQPEQAAAWRAKLGMPDLPGDVYARP